MEYIAIVFPVALLAALGVLFIKEYIPAVEPGAEVVSAPETGRMTRLDRIAMLAITLVYAVTAFMGLGDTRGVVSFCRFEEKGEYALITLREETELSAIKYYTGLNTGSYRLQLSRDGENWLDQPDMEQKYNDLFKWLDAELGEDNGPVRYVRITAPRDMQLGEIALFAADGHMLTGDEISCPDGCAALFDEQELVPAEQTYLNSTYFDEIYHARTAYENIENIYPYEVSHPPLGKLIISLGIRLFGMTPFGWRFMGTLFGVLMLPAMYVFLKRLFSRSLVASACTAIFAFDFMHLVQTRIATIDTYGVFFTILMYLFMYLYLTAERGTARRTVYLGLSGLCFGLGAASKWTCVYSGAGLGVIWLLERIMRGAQMRREERMGDYARETAALILWSILFFVIVPCAVYYVSYYPYGKASGMSGAGMFFRRDYLDIVLENQKFMFTYHNGVHSEHPYSSRWYQWIFDIRPILYYLRYYDGGTRASFGAFLNPVLCWGGLISIFAMGHLALRRRDRRAGFILLGYLAQLVPWMLIGRTTFEYHYFPSAVFLTLALGYVFELVIEHRRTWRRMVFGVTFMSLGLFVVFYPVLTGVTVPSWYGTTFLRWIPGCWPF